VQRHVADLAPGARRQTAAHLRAARRGVIAARIDRTVLIPRVDHVSRIDNTFAFMWTRRQLAVRPALAMTTNKAQRQASECAGMRLADPCFAYG